MSPDHLQTTVKAVADQLPSEDVTLLAEAVGFKAGASPYMDDDHLAAMWERFRIGACKGADMRERGVL